MKFILVVLFFLSAALTAQKIENNYVDEFTGKAIVETNWNVFQMASKNYSYMRLRKVDSTLYLNMKIVTHRILSIDDGDPLMLKLDSDEVLKLYNLDFTISERGGGATGLSWSKVPGMYLRFIIQPEQQMKLLNQSVVKTRLYTSRGYIEGKVKPKFAERLKVMLELLTK